MSFDFLDFVNELIIEQTLELPAETLVRETEPHLLPSDDRVSRFRAITKKLVAQQQANRLRTIKNSFSEYEKSDSLYQIAIRSRPKSIDVIFNDIVRAVTTTNESIPTQWTMAHRSESLGKDNDAELEKIWVRMFMLGYIQKAGSSDELD